AKPEIRLRLGPRESAGAVAVALRRIPDDLVLIRRDQFVLFPDRCAHGAVGVDRVIRPVAAGIGKIKSAGKRAGDDAKAKFLREQLGVTLDAFEIARAAV